MDLWRFWRDTEPLYEGVWSLISKKNINQIKEDIHMRTIKRWEFVKMVSERVHHECPQWVIYYVIKAVFHCMEDILKDGNRFVAGETFSLEPKYKEEATYSNFGKEPVTIPGHYEPCFKPYHRLKDACAELTKEKMENIENEGKNNDEQK